MPDQPTTVPRAPVRLTDAAMKLRISYHATHRLLMIGVLKGRRHLGAWQVDADSVDAEVARRAAQDVTSDGAPQAA